MTGKEYPNNYKTEIKQCAIVGTEGWFKGKKKYWNDEIDKRIISKVN